MMEINKENALKFLDTYFDVYDTHVGKNCWLIVKNELETLKNKLDTTIKCIESCDHRNVQMTHKGFLEMLNQMKEE